MAVLLGILTFTAVTLLIGDPFYEKISELVEDRFGGVPDEVEVGCWRSLRRSLVDSLRLIGLSVLVGIPLFLLGFIPVVGQTVIPVLGAAVGGWLLAVELTGVPFQRRGQRLRRPPGGAARPAAARAGLRGGGLLLLPDPARRDAADARRGRRRAPCSPARSLGPADRHRIEPVPVRPQADARTTSSVGRTTASRHVEASPLIRPSIWRAMVRPMSTIGCRTVVSGGSL